MTSLLRKSLRQTKRRVQSEGNDQLRQDGGGSPRCHREALPGVQEEGLQEQLSLDFELAMLGWSTAGSPISLWLSDVYICKLQAELLGLANTAFTGPSAFEHNKLLHAKKRQVPALLEEISRVEHI